MPNSAIGGVDQRLAVLGPGDVGARRRSPAGRPPPPPAASRPAGRPGGRRARRRRRPRPASGRRPRRAPRTPRSRSPPGRRAGTCPGSCGQAIGASLPSSRLVGPDDRIRRCGVDHLTGPGRARGPDLEREERHRGQPGPEPARHRRGARRPPALRMDDAVLTYGEFRDAALQVAAGAAGARRRSPATAWAWCCPTSCRSRWSSTAR